MHKKRIKDKTYFYTSVRDEEGKVKTIYLGSNKRNAKQKEEELGLSNNKKSFNLHSIIAVLLVLAISLTGFFTITGFDVLNVTEEVQVEEIIESDSRGEGVVSTEDLEIQELIPNSNENTSSQEITNESEGEPKGVLKDTSSIFSIPSRL